MWSGCHLISESFREEIVSLNGKQTIHHVVYLVFASTDQGVDFCISLDAHSYRFVLGTPTGLFRGQLPIQSGVRWYRGSEKQKTQCFPLEGFHFSWWEWLNECKRSLVSDRDHVAPFTWPQLQPSNNKWLHTLTQPARPWPGARLTKVSGIGHPCVCHVGLRDNSGDRAQLLGIHYATFYFRISSWTLN